MGPDFPTKNTNDNNFEKVNIKFEIKIKQSTAVPNFSQFAELQFLGPNLPKKIGKGGSLEQNLLENNLF